jgi:shikimate dehydrogenase
MSKQIIKLGLIGKKVSKSLSGKIHGFILRKLGFDCEYESLSITPDELDGVVRRLLGDFDGFNITIPYKRDIFEYLDEIVEDAFDCGSVNTVVCSTRKGYNTDGVGFLLMLENAGVQVQGKKVLVLGAGGSGRSTAAALKRAGATVTAYRRNQAELAEVCEQLGVGATANPEEGGYDILVNCTGVGMHDTEGKSPVSMAAFAGAEWAVDLIYTPVQSEFLRLAKTQGVKTINGAAMLFYQAYYADCLYLNKTPNTKEAKEFYEEFLKEE